MGARYYRIISIDTSSRSNKTLKRSTSKDWLSINYSVKKGITNDELYSGHLPESLETIELERYISNCRKNNKYPNISQAFEKGFAFDGNKKNFLGYTDALIELKFSSKYAHRFDYYSKGLYFNGIKYVRYKRSASSARNGKCLFIMEELYNRHMKKWSDCGLSIENVDDLTSWEAYRGLTLSSIESTISLPCDSILILKDHETPIPDDVTRPFSDLQETNEKTLTNTIWDGEGLLDESIFLSREKYSSPNTSMLFLRGRFFKTCGFRTKLQKWFSDNNITSVEQLNGFTLAKTPKDIKLVITESSLKFCKFINADDEDFLAKSLTNWVLGQGINLSANYKNKSKNLLLGIVKTNHPTRFYDGKLVRTNYQLLNTLPLSREEVKELIRPSIEYLNLASESPLFFRDLIKCTPILKNLDPIPESNELDVHYVSESDDDLADNSTQYKSYYVNEILKRTNNLSGTKLYKDYRKAVLSNFRTHLIKGHILVEGTLATLFGNPAEFLYCTLKRNADYVLGSQLQYTKDNVNCISDVLQQNEIYCSHFNHEETLTCARNPHITMGNNLIVSNNTSINFYEEYFTLSDEIVCVNAINCNIQQTLNGADYDSDTMLITNNEILVNSAKTAVSLFKTPVNILDSNKKPIDPTISIEYQLSEIDAVISDNQIGQIINLSQELNSLIWESVRGQESKQKHYNLQTDFEDKYNEVTKLAILSNVSLDRAKRVYKIDINEALEEIKLHERLYRYHPVEAVIEERPLYLQNLLGIKPSDYTRDIYDIYTYFYQKPDERIKITTKKHVKKPNQKILDSFGSNINLYQYDILDEDTENFIMSIYTINNNATHDCTMSHLYEIVKDKKFEKEIKPFIKELISSHQISNSKPLKLTDLINIPPTYSYAEGYAESIKEVVKKAFNSQRKIANKKQFSKEEKYTLRNEILDKCFSDVDNILKKYHSHVDYLIYLLLKNIDDNTLLTKEDKENKFVGYSSLLLSCICNHTYQGKHIFYDMVSQKAKTDNSVPQYYLHSDPSGDINIYGIKHSIQKA